MVIYTKVDVISHIQTGRMWLETAEHLIKKCRYSKDRRQLQLAEMYISLAEDIYKEILDRTKK